MAAFPSLTSSPLLFSTLSGHLIKSSFSLISCDPWQRGTSPPAGPRPGLLPPLRAPCSSPWSGHLSFPRCALRTTPPYWQKSSTSRPDKPTIRVPVTGFSASPCSRSPVFNASNVLFWRVVVVLYLPKFRWMDCDGACSGAGEPDELGTGVSLKSSFEASCLSLNLARRLPKQSQFPFPTALLAPSSSRRLREPRCPTPSWRTCDIIKFRPARMLSDFSLSCL